MRNLFFSLIFFHLSLNPTLFAQPSIQWQKCLGGSENDQAACIQQTSDGGYIVAGYTLSKNGDVFGNHGHFDFWVVKLSNTGVVQWAKTLGGNDDDRAYSICESTDGGYIVVGFTQSNDGDVSVNHGDKDAWVVKLSNTGALEWEKTLGGSGWEEAWSIRQTKDDGYILAGRSNSNNGDVSGNHAGSLDFWVVKLSSIGLIEWQKSLGGSDEDTAVTVKQTSDEGYIIVGEAKSTDGDVIGNNGNVDFWVVKLNSLGTLMWQNALGGVGLDVASDIYETGDGFIACGYEGSTNTGDVTGHHGLFDYWIVKLNKTGDLLWQKALGGSEGDWGRNILQTNDGMFIVAGTTQSSDGDVLINNGIETAWVLKLNDTGEILWQKSLGGSLGEGSNCIIQTSDGGFMVAGYAWSNDGDVWGNHGGGDFWIVKLSPESSPTTTPTALPLEIYPNPATHTISLQVPRDQATAAGETPLYIRINDLLGREISQQTFQPGKALDIAALPNGMYLLTATDTLGKVFSGRFMKQE
jgi:hypothetical protein